jgi:hypothetical protein
MSGILMKKEDKASMRRKRAVGGKERIERRC